MWKSEALLAAIAKASPRDCITEARMAELMGRAPRDIEMSCLKLRKHGLLAKTERGCHKLTRAGRAFVAEGQTLRSGPRGARTGRVVQKGSLRARAWRAMRIKRKFTLADIAMLCVEGGERDVESNLYKYLGALERAGYVQKLSVRERGAAATSNGFVRWALLVDNGPLPPVWRPRAGTLYDPNSEADIKLGRTQCRQSPSPYDLNEGEGLAGLARRERACG